VKELPIENIDSKALDIIAILKEENVVNLLDDQKLNAISSQVLEDYQKDLISIEPKIQKYKNIIQLCNFDVSEKTSPWPGASNISFPLLAQALIDFSSSALPAMLRDGEVVKAKVIGKDDGRTYKNEYGDFIYVKDPKTGEI